MHVHPYYFPSHILSSHQACLCLNTTTKTQCIKQNNQDIYRLAYAPVFLYSRMASILVDYILICPNYPKLAQSLTVLKAFTKTTIFRSTPTTRAPHNSHHTIPSIPSLSAFLYQHFYRYALTIPVLKPHPFYPLQAQSINLHTFKDRKQTDDPILTLSSPHTELV